MNVKIVLFDIKNLDSKNWQENIYLSIYQTSMYQEYTFSDSLKFPFIVHPNLPFQ